MENKLACKRDSEKKQAMPLAARSLGKMSKMRDTIVSHYALAALHSGDKSNSFGWSTKVTCSACQILL